MRIRILPDVLYSRCLTPATTLGHLVWMRPISSNALLSGHRLYYDPCRTSVVGDLSSALHPGMWKEMVIVSGYIQAWTSDFISYSASDAKPSPLTSTSSASARPKTNATLTSGDIYDLNVQLYNDLSSRTYRQSWTLCQQAAFSTAIVAAFAEPLFWSVIDIRYIDRPDSASSFQYTEASCRSRTARIAPRDNTTEQHG